MTRRLLESANGEVTCPRSSYKLCDFRVLMLICSLTYLLLISAYTLKNAILIRLSTTIWHWGLLSCNDYLKGSLQLKIEEWKKGGGAGMRRRREC